MQRIWIMADAPLALPPRATDCLESFLMNKREGYGKRAGREERESMEVHEMGKIAPKRNIWHLGRSLGDYRPVAYIFIARQHTDARY